MTRNKKIIFLTGQMGSGKSFLGKHIANHLNLDFFDTDDIISEETELSISEIFDNYGEQHFRKLESKVLDKIINAQNPCIIATGGGFPCSGNNANDMYNHGLVIHLKASYELLEINLKEGISNRPLLNKPNLDLRLFLSNQYTSRKAYYEKAHILVSLKSRNEGFTHLIDRLSPFFKPSI